MENVAETWHKMMTEERFYSFKNQKEISKRSNYISTGGQVNRLCYIHAMEHSE